MTDARVLDALAEEMDIEVGLRSLEAIRAELLQLAPTGPRPALPTAAASAPPAPGEGQALLATWAELIDAGRMQVGDEHLAGTAKPVLARLSAATAAGLGVAAG